MDAIGRLFIGWGAQRERVRVQNLKRPKSDAYWMVLRRYCERSTVNHIRSFTQMPRAKLCNKRGRVEKKLGLLI